MIEASDVPLMTCTRKPTVGGIAILPAAGSRSEAVLPGGVAHARLPPPIWPGIASTQPRQISPRKAAV